MSRIWLSISHRCLLLAACGLQQAAKSLCQGKPSEAQFSKDGARSRSGEQTFDPPVTACRTSKNKPGAQILCSRAAGTRETDNGCRHRSRRITSSTSAVCAVRLARAEPGAGGSSPDRRPAVWSVALLQILDCMQAGRGPEPMVHASWVLDAGFSHLHEARRLWSPAQILQGYH